MQRVAWRLAVTCSNSPVCWTCRVAVLRPVIYRLRLPAMHALSSLTGAAGPQQHAAGSSCSVLCIMHAARLILLDDESDSIKVAGSMVGASCTRSDYDIARLLDIPRQVVGLALQALAEFCFFDGALAWVKTTAGSGGK